MLSLPVLSVLGMLAITLALPRATAAYARWFARRAGRVAWSDPVLRRRDVAELVRYHDARRASAGEDAYPPLDARTWLDLDLDAVLAHLDRASGAPGQQVLYAWLHSPVQSPSRSARASA